MLRQCLRKASIESISIWKAELFNAHATKRQEEWTVDQLESPSDGQISSDKLRSFLHITIPRIKSRILHAASAIFPEIGRGHFVPMLTIALACLGRILSILLQIGRECLTCLKENKVQINGDVDHLFQIGHDELVVKLNHFVNGLRWKHAVRKFRLSKGFSDDRRNVQNCFVSKSSSPNNMIANEAQFLNNDTGEIVTNTSAGLTEMFRSGQDDLLGVIPPSRVENCIGSEAISDETCRALELSKKRKRKDKKKKRSTANANIHDNVGHNNQTHIPVSSGKDIESAKGGNNDFEAVFHDTFNGDPTQREVPISSEGKVAEAKSTIVKKERKQKKKAKDIDHIFDDSYPVPTQKQDGSNMLKKKKATKKKKSSVIDDIFG